jgi:2Fe-2S ferredoxin
MPRITFVEPDGTTRAIDAVSGLTVMENAVRHDIAGIAATCGGCCTCATCHVVVAPEWSEIAGAPSPEESEILAFADSCPEAGSRLSCQLRMSELLDGIVVRVPKAN